MVNEERYIYMIAPGASEDAHRFFAVLEPLLNNQNIILFWPHQGTDSDKRPPGTVFHGKFQDIESALAVVALPYLPSIECGIDVQIALDKRQAIIICYPGIVSKSNSSQFTMTRMVNGHQNYAGDCVREITSTDNPSEMATLCFDELQKVLKRRKRPIATESIVFPNFGKNDLKRELCKIEGIEDGTPITVYLAGALTHVTNSSAKSFFDRIVEVLDTISLEYNVKFDIRNPYELNGPHEEPHLKPSEVYNNNYTCISESDFIIAYLDKASIGVGMELVIASQTNTPIVALYTSQRKIKVVLGNPTIALPIHSPEHDIFEELYSQLVDLLHYVTEILKSIRDKPDETWRQELRRAWESKGFTQMSFAQKIGYTSPTLGRFINAKMEMQFATIENYTLRICEGLEIDEENIIDFLRSIRCPYAERMHPEKLPLLKYKRSESE